MLDFLLSNQDLQEGLCTKIRVWRTKEEATAVFYEEAGHVDVVVGEVSEKLLEEKEGREGKAEKGRGGSG